MSNTDRTWLSCADTAKLVRKALKADFPGVKFSVRSSTYAGGASIDVRWTDGPIERDVRAKTLCLYTGASFDGMTDMQSYHDSMLMTDDGPKVVHFGADYVHGQRDISDVRLSIYRVELERFLGEKLPRRGDSRYRSMRVPASFGRAYAAMGECEHPMLAQDSHNGEYLSNLVWQMGHNRSWKGERCPGTDHPLVMLEAYCPGCGRWQKGHEQEPHLR